MINRLKKLYKENKRRLVKLSFWVLGLGYLKYLTWGFENITNGWYIFFLWLGVIGLWYYGKKIKMFYPERIDFGLSH